MDLTRTKLYGIDEEKDWCGAFYVKNDSALLEQEGCERIDRIDIFIKIYGDDPHILLRGSNGVICEVRLKTNEYNNHWNNAFLSKKELKAFNKYMHKKVPGTNIPNWVHLSTNWNSMWLSLNEGKTSGLVNLNQDCPDYSTIKNPE